jgi:predicted MFS family arabinose efflux permease
MSATGMVLTMVRSVPVIIVGLTLEASGVFICQSASSSHVGWAAREGRSSAAGIYVSFYYLGGCLGSIIPGFFWKQAGWPSCVGIFICMQLLAVLIAYRFWHD